MSWIIPRSLQLSRCVSHLKNNIFSKNSSSRYPFGTALALGLAASTSYTIHAHEKDAQNSSFSTSTSGKASLPSRVFFVLGGPGAGKGTQCSMIVKEYGFVHLSAGDLLRAERNSGSKNGQMIDRMINEGQIVPVEVTLALLKEAMEKSGQHLFLIDGFPRNYDNLQGWEGAMGDVQVDGVIFYDCPEEVMIERLLERGKTSGRSDDNTEAIRKRFHTYRDSTMPVIDEYEKKNLVYRIAATASPDVVFKSSKGVIEPVVKSHIVNLTQKLLDVVASKDFDTYKELCDEKLTAFEPESNGQMVEGLKFHEFYFKKNECIDGKRNQSTIVNPFVKLMGDVAIISYHRLIQTDDSTASFEETRIWRKKNGKWKNVHLHRS